MKTTNRKPLFHYPIVALQIVSRETSADPAWRHKTTTMTSSEAFVETMVSHGTELVFGIVGSAFMDALDIFEPAGIRFVSVQHEQNAVHMADGYSRYCRVHSSSENDQFEKSFEYSKRENKLS